MAETASSDSRPSRTPIFLSAVVMPGSGQFAQKRIGAGIFFSAIFLLCFIGLATAAVRWVFFYYRDMSRWLTSDGAMPPTPSFAPILWLLAFSLVVYVINLCDVYLAYLRECERWGQKKLEERLRSMLPIVAALLAFVPVTRGEAAADALYRAILSNDVAWVAGAIEQGETNAARAVFAGGVTPMHVASSLNQPSIVGLLFVAGADADARTAGGFTPLHWAASRNAADAMKVLIQSGADVNAKSNRGITPLHWAAARNAIEAMKLLISAGADLTCATESGFTPLHWAVMNNAEQAQILLAFHIVSREFDDAASSGMDTAKTPDAGPPQTVVEKPEETEPAAETAEPGSQPGVPVEPPAERRFARTLSVPIGFGQTLEFVWVDIGRCWIGKYEVTNGQYRRFRPRHSSGSREGFSLDGDEQPVAMVSWHDAAAYCKWLNENFGDRIPRGFVFRLPTELEWVLAARCGDNRPYPWGTRWPPPYGNFSDLSARQHLSLWRGITGYDDGFVVSCPVDQSGSNEMGIYGLAGNVWEWCDDWFDEKKIYRIRRGGSWDFDDRSSLRIDHRGFDRPETRDEAVGFRVVVALP